MQRLELAGNGWEDSFSQMPQTEIYPSFGPWTCLAQKVESSGDVALSLYSLDWVPLHTSETRDDTSPGKKMTSGQRMLAGLRSA